jgi:hypothetical protein
LRGLKSGRASGEGRRQNHSIPLPTHDGKSLSESDERAQPPSAAGRRPSN